MALSPNAAQQPTLPEDRWAPPAWLAPLCDALSDAMLLVTADGLVHYFNPAGRRLFAPLSEGECVRLTSLFTPSSAHVITHEALPAADREGSWKSELTARGADGTELPVSAVLARQPSEEGTPGGYSVLLRDRTPEKRAEANSLEALRALQQSEERFATAFHNAPFGLALSDVAEGRYIDVNESYCQFFGYRRDEIVGKRSADLQLWAQPHERDTMTRLLEAEGRVRDLEVCGYTRDGRPVVCLLSADLARIGGRACIVSTLRDITAQRTLEAALREGEERYRALVEFNPVGIVLHQHDRIVLANRSAVRLVGAATDRDLVGRSPLGFVVPEDRPDAAARIARIEAGETHLPSFEMRLRALDGTTLTVESQTVAIPLAGARAALVILHDISARRAAEDALRASEERYRIVSEQTGQLVFDYAPMTGRIEWGGAAERVTGWTLADLAAFDMDRWEERIHAEDRARMHDSLERARFAAGPFHCTYRLQRRDGQYVHLESHGVFLPGPDGYGQRLLGTMSDVSDQLRLEDQLRHAQKMESLGRLAGGVAHDFNNLLTIIGGNLEVLQDRSDLAPEPREAVEAIDHCAQLAAALTQQLLTISRRQFLHKGPVVLAEVISRMSRLLARTLGERVKLDTPEATTSPCVLADRGMVEQVLLNLAVNARDAMHHGGRLTLRAAAVTIDESYRRRIPQAQPGRFGCIEVADTGAGIPPDVLPRIFEPFFTTKAAGKGTGLGLAMVYGIVTQHGGWVEVDSQPGTGTTFRVFFPENPEPIQPPRTTASGSPFGTGEMILLVEDEAPVRALIERMLQRHGYRVHSCVNAIAAQEWWRQQSQKPDLLFTDVVLPEGIDGPELARALRAEAPSMRVLYMSGYSPDSLGPIDAATGEYFLPKPFEAAVLLRLVRQILAAAASPS